MKVYFDLSTSARWSGHAVGIVRVERELGRRVLPVLGDEGGYCLFLPREGGLRLLPAEAAAQIIAGELQIRFEDGGPAIPGAGQASLRRRIRNAILRRPKLYQAIQRLRGLSFSLEQIAEVRRIEADPDAQPAKGPIIRTIDDVAPERVPLGPDTLIVSAGLDWEYKDIRGLYRMKAKHGFQYAAVIYDLIPLIMPHYVVPAYVNLLRDYFGEVFWLADYCMSISACTQRDMYAHCERYGVPAPAADYFPLGGDLPTTLEDEEGELPHALQGKRYAIFVSTIEPRKNHRTLYQAWDRCIREGRVDPETCRLLFVGMGGWNTGDLRAEMAANPATRDTIVTMSNISDADLRRLYEGAEFSLFPSFYEGYGLPVAEALSYGKPCISSDAGSLPEIGGNLVTYVDPHNPLAWADAIVEAFDDRAEMARRANAIQAQFKAPTWDAAADIFFARLTALVQKHGAAP